jgi:hypothetical protein
MEKSTMILIFLAIVVLVGAIFTVLIRSEEKKNDPTLDDPRDSDTRPGNQGIKHNKK